ncbi:MAG TPA: Ig-like domain-containing protein [bacterium]|nr:Ig-like domain-containing protein [bacterium]
MRKKNAMRWLLMIISSALVMACAVAEEDCLCDEGFTCNELGECVPTGDLTDQPALNDEQSDQTIDETTDDPVDTNLPEEDPSDVTPVVDQDQPLPDNGPQDTTAPTIQTVTPGDGATDILTDAKITVYYSEAVQKELAISPANFKVEIDGVAVEGVREYFASSNFFAQFTPTIPYTAGKTVTATVTTAVRDLAGNALAEEKQWSFAVKEDKEAPLISKVYPEKDKTGVAPSTTISITFNEPVQNVDTASIFLIENGDTSIEYTATLGADNRTAYVAPAATYNGGKLLEMTRYMVKVNNKITDFFGNVIDLGADAVDEGSGVMALSWEFTTGSNVLLFEDFESADAATKWTEANINKLLNASDPFLYDDPLWVIGTPATEGITVAQSGSKVMATLPTEMLPDQYNLRNALYYKTPFIIPDSGLDIDFYAYVNCPKYPNGSWRGGMIVYGCEDTNFKSGGKCSHVQGDAANTAVMVTLTSDPVGYIDTFTGMYTLEFNSAVTGAAPDDTYIHFTGSIGPEHKQKSLYLMFEFTKGNDSNTAPGIYIDDLTLQGK